MASLLDIVVADEGKSFTLKELKELYPAKMTLKELFEKIEAADLPGVRIVRLGGHTERSPNVCVQGYRLKTAPEIASNAQGCFITATKIEFESVKKGLRTIMGSGLIEDMDLAEPNGNGSIGRKEPLRWNFTVAGKSINYSIWDFSGTTHADLAAIDPHSKNGTNLTRVFVQLDVVLICYDIADPDTLFSALNCWVPKIKTLTLSKEKLTNEVPIILVGCQSDARQDRDSPGSTIPHPNLRASRRPLSFGRELHSPVSANQALKLSQQSGCSLYVETSAKECSRSAISAFEVAALVTLGQLQQHPPLLQSSPAPPIPPKAVKISPPVPPKPRRAVSHMALNKENIYTPEPLKQKSISKVNIFPSSPKLSLKTSKNRSSASLLSLSSQRTPKIPRKSGKHERMITIKCQRLNSAKEYEEVEVEVPEPVYETLRYQNDPSGARQEMALSKAKRNTFTSKIRSMFLKT